MSQSCSTEPCKSSIYPFRELKRPLQFLGLYDTTLCNVTHIPAYKVQIHAVNAAAVSFLIKDRFLSFRAVCVTNRLLFYSTEVFSLDLMRNRLFCSSSGDRV